MVDGEAAGRVGGWVVRRLAGGDCELVSDGFLAQPVNAVSSLSYVVAGIAIAVASRRHEPPRTASLVYAGLVAAVGVGSALFHGPQPEGAQVLHDVPILLTALFVLVHDAGLLRTRPAGRAMAPTVALVAIVVGTAVPALVGPLTGALLAGAVLAELLVARRGLRPAGNRPRLVAAIVVAGVLAVVAWVLGRSGSGACDPTSAVQFHAVWHALSALVLGLWWILATPISRSTSDLGLDRGAIRNDPARDR